MMRRIYPMPLKRFNLAARTGLHVLALVSTLGLAKSADDKVGADATIEALNQRGIELERSVEIKDMNDALALTWRAIELERRGRTDEAVRQLARAIEFTDHKMSEMAPMISPHEADEQMRWASQQDALAYAICTHHPKNAAAVALGARVAHARKGKDIERIAEFFRRVRQLPADDAGRLAYERSMEDLATLHAFVYGRSDEAATAAVRQLEQEVRQQSHDLAARQWFGTIVGPDLPLEFAATGVVVLDFVTYRDFDFNAQRGRWGDAWYGAFITTRPLGEEPTITFINLGARATIDVFIENAVAALRNDRADPKPTTNALYDRLIAPLVPHLIDRSGRTNPRVIVVPDGDITSVPFDALWDGTHWLIDRYDFHYAVSARHRDSNSFSASPTGQRGEATVLGNPELPPEGRITNALGVRSDLPWAQAEASAITALLGCAPPLTNRNATVSAVRSAHSQILHIASHGLAVGRDEPPSTGLNRELSVEPDTVAEPPAAGAHPKIARASLVLAGAGALNEKGARILRGERGVGDDGLLSADEVLNLDLEKTQLVTLSACQSGRGYVQTGAGEYGLLRAFAVAGAKTVVGSLWPVDDRATADLMLRFYARLARGFSRGDALHAAMRSVRRSFPHPVYWSSFVLLGASQSPLAGWSDQLGGMPTGPDTELPDQVTIGDSTPPSYRRHVPNANLELKPGPVWQPAWESESGHRLGQTIWSRVSLMNIWAFEDGATLHVMLQVSLRAADGRFGSTTEIEIAQYPIDREAGTQCDVKFPEPGRVLVRTYQFPTLAGSGWIETLEIVIQSTGAASVARSDRRPFIGDDRPAWAR